MAKSIKKATEVGFCPGVRKAIESTKRAAQSSPVFTLGRLVHNDAVVGELESMGIKVIHSLEEAHGLVAISAHGAPSQVYDELKRRGLKFIDTTCPIVRKAQRKASQFASEGYFVIVYGDPNHTEVKGLIDRAGPNARAGLSVSGIFEGRAPKRLAILSQTTRLPHEVQAFLSELLTPLDRFEDIRVAVTVCPHVVRRVREAVSLASTTDFVVVVGDPQSSNSNRLVESCNQVGHARLVWSPHMIDREWQELKAAKTVGVTSGTSSPYWLIDEVVEAIERLA
ncbi:MAG: 4-hydroxy-3-methylbut-2-enyl diphosphate reductase [Chloroflexi bacterium]|nr:MAG: 4-hydroxy-3-methylbut-2-enyl diphosphate reductase [Chloroflexota bacterium]